MRRLAWFSFVLLVVALCGARSAPAQNLVTNPDFDVDKSGWAGTGVWDPFDVDGSPTSGSATWVNTNPSTSGALYLMQCVELAGFIESYDVQGWVFIPSGQAGAGHAQVTAWFCSDSACDDFIWSCATPSVSALDVWQLATLTDWTPTGAASVYIGLSSQKYGDGDFQVFHDAVFFGPNPTIDLCRWVRDHGHVAVEPGGRRTSAIRRMRHRPLRVG